MQAGMHPSVWEKQEKEKLANRYARSGRAVRLAGWYNSTGERKDMG